MFSLDLIFSISSSNKVVAHRLTKTLINFASNFCCYCHWNQQNLLKSRFIYVHNKHQLYLYMASEYLLQIGMFRGVTRSLSLSVSLSPPFLTYKHLRIWYNHQITSRRHHKLWRKIDLLHQLFKPEKLFPKIQQKEQ